MCLFWDGLQCLFLHTTQGRDLRRSSFKFYQDTMKFIHFLACVAFFGMAFSVYSYIRLKVRICVSQDSSFTKMHLLACVAFFGMSFSVYSYIRLKVKISVGQDLNFIKMP